jgi:hypothetical protein
MATPTCGGQYGAKAAFVAAQFAELQRQRAYSVHETS